MACKVASFPIIEDFSHFEGVSPLPFPETFPSWPIVDPSKSESLPGLESGHENMDPPVLLSYTSVKEPPVLLSFGSGKEPTAFLSFVSGKDCDVRDFASDLSISVSGTFSSLPPTLSAASFTQSSGKPSIVGSQFSELLLLPVVKQEHKEVKTFEKKLESSSSTSSASSLSSSLSPSHGSVSSTSPPTLTTDSESMSSLESVTSSPESATSFTLLSLLDGDRKNPPTSERKTKADRKTTKRDREEKKQPGLSKRGRKKRNSDDSDGGSEFDSNDSGCWAESKKERNKKAASNYRKRRKQYVGELEAKVATLTEKVNKERASTTAMTGEIQMLKERIECLESLLVQHNLEVPKKKSISTTCKSNKKAKIN